METRHATQAQLETAAKTARVRLGELRPLNAKGDRFAFRVLPDPETRHPTAPAGERNPPPIYARRSQSDGHLLSGCLCWHGFEAFFKALYDLAPETIARTSLATYKGRADFFRVYPGTAGRNVGSMVRPVAVSDACACADYVEIGPRGGVKRYPGSGAGA